MISSSKPRKQRLFRFTSPLHVKQRYMHAHVDKQLKAKLKISRAVRIVSGDSVKVMSGSHRGKVGKVASVNLRSNKIAVSGIVRKDAKGKEKQIMLSPSNVYITELNLEDKIRASALNLAQVKSSKSKNENKAPDAASKANDASKAEGKDVKENRAIKVD